MTLCCIFPFLLGFAMKFNTKSICFINFVYKFVHLNPLCETCELFKMICISVHNFYFLFLCSALKMGSISSLISTFQLIPFADRLATVRIVVKTEKKNGRDIWDVWEMAKMLNHSIIDVCGFPSRTIFFPIISSKSKPDRSLNHHK